MIHISSEDVDSGNSYAGTWYINTTLQGLYNLKSQYMDTSIVPWIYSGCNNWRFTWQTITSTDSFSVSDQAIYSDDPTIQLNYISTQLNTILAQVVIDDIYVTANVVYNSVTDEFDVTFSESITVGWENDQCTTKYVFNKTGNETGFSISLSRKYLTTNPKWIECYITESSSQYITSRSNSPALLLSTKDNEFTDQEITIRNPTTSLNIQLHRTNIPNIPVPITSSWNLIFEK